MIDLLPYQQSIENALTNIPFSSQPSNLYDPLNYFLKIGGKRMRPILALMACEMFGQKYEQALNAAIAVEIFHNFSLIHDDIMDKAPLRRGQETVHKKWNDNIAILSGDVLLVKAYQEIEKYEAETALALLKIFNRTAVEVCEGQQYDMDFETEQYVSVEQYIEMIKNKTAVLLGCSLEMGSIVAGATIDDYQNIYEFGVNLGIAFQLQDDLLDVYGDQSKFGKQIAGDIIANKKTFLWLTALKDASAEQKLELNSLLKETNPSTKIDGVIAIYNQLQIKEKTQKKMHQYYHAALENINRISVSEAAKKPLLSLGEFLMQRDH
ncbi:MAG: polyprenyl synthetase family protein [Putridiphycobacter sp.]|nr:polyprenyl synthetase family protein [Putridiphycobacter sp.]